MITVSAFAVNEREASKRVAPTAMTNAFMDVSPKSNFDMRKRRLLELVPRLLLDLSSVAMAMVEKHRAQRRD